MKKIDASMHPCIHASVNKYSHLATNCKMGADKGEADALSLDWMKVEKLFLLLGSLLDFRVDHQVDAESTASID